MGFSGAIGSKGFNNSIGASGVELPDYKRQRTRVQVPQAKDLAMWFMSVPNDKASRPFSRTPIGGVSALRDFSGNRNHLRQSVVGKRPTVLQSAQGNRAAIQFTTAQYLVGNNASAFDIGTGLFDVYMIVNMASASATQVFYATKSSIAASTSGVAAMAANDEKLRAQGANGSSAKNTAKTTAAYNAKGYFLLRVSRTASSELRLYTLCSDGTTQAKTIAGGGLSFDGGNFSLGALNNGNSGCAAKIVEVLAYKGTRLSNANRDKVTSYLSTKYKLGL